MNRLAASVLAFGLLMPLVVSAQAAGQQAAGARRNFCTIIADKTAGERPAKRFDEQQARLEAKRQERDQRLEERRAQRDQKLAELQSAADARRADLIDKLGEKAQTDGQKQALAAFQNAVQNAVDTKRAAFDKAQDDFRTGLDAAIAGRKSQIDAALQAFSVEIAAAEDQAKADCAVTGANPATVREQLRDSIRNSQEALKAAVQSAQKVGEQTEALIAARKQAVDQARTDFRAAMAQARTDLKAAFVEEPAEESAEEPATE